MIKCRAVRKSLPQLLYGELEGGAGDAVRRHLDACPRCAGIYRGLQETVRTMDEKKFSDPGPEFWDGYWDRLRLRMEREGGTGPIRVPVASGAERRAPLARRWIPAAAGAAAILLLGIVIGRTFLGRPPVVVERNPSGRPSVPATAAADAVSVRASRYLERSKVILLALSNFDPATQDVYGLNLPLQKKTSEALIREAAVLRKDLRDSDRKLARLVGELEKILVQIADIKSETDTAAVEVIKAGLESQDLLFRINLSELRRAPEGGSKDGRPRRADSKPKGARTGA